MNTGLGLNINSDSAKSLGSRDCRGEVSIDARPTSHA